MPIYLSHIQPMPMRRVSNIRFVSQSERGRRMAMTLEAIQREEDIAIFAAINGAISKPERPISYIRVIRT